MTVSAQRAQAAACACADGRATHTPGVCATCRRGEGATASALAQRLEDNLHRLTGDSYVHHGVGCDVCGGWRRAFVECRPGTRAQHCSCGSVTAGWAFHVALVASTVAVGILS